MTNSRITATFMQDTNVDSIKFTITLVYRYVFKFSGKVDSSVQAEACRHHFVVQYSAAICN